MNKREEEKLKRQQEKLKKELERTEAMSVYEKEHSDCQYICGIDEVGRGPFAGPVVAGAVTFSVTYLQLLRPCRPHSPKISDGWIFSQPRLSPQLWQIFLWSFSCL